MTKWEYVTVPLLTHATKQILDNWGDEGYELVAVVPGPNAEQLVAYMKRPKAVSEATRRSGWPRSGLTLPPVAAPVAAYVPAVRTGNYVYTSGQLPLVDGKLQGTGKVGDAVAPEDAAALARTAALNALAAAASVAGGLDAITRIVKVTCFVASAPGVHRPGAGRQRRERAADRGARRRRAARPQRGRHGGAAARHPGRGRADRRGRVAAGAAACGYN